MNSWKKLNSEAIHQNPFWTYQHDVFETAKGEKGDYYYAITTGSVMIVPTLADGRIAMVNNYRYLFDRYSLEFPGGAMGKDQTPVQAAVRELAEETSYKAEELINVGRFCPFNGMTQEICQVFLAKGLRKIESALEVYEQMEVALRRLDEVDDLVRRNEIWDGETLAAWILVRPHLLREE